MKTRSPKRNQTKITTMIEMWGQLRPNKSFFGMTLAQFEAAMKPSLDARDQVSLAETNLSVAITQRLNADSVCVPLIKHVVDAIVADKDEGRDGELYKALGYVRASERATGLTRRRRESRTQPTDEATKST